MQTPWVVLEIDDNSPPDDAPFTSDPSVWSFVHDCNLATRTGAATFRAVHAALDDSRLRGYPPKASRETFRLFDKWVGSEEVTWLTGAELATAGHLAAGR